MNLYKSFADRINQFYDDILRDKKMVYRNFYERESSWFVFGTNMRPLHFDTYKDIKEGQENFNPHGNVCDSYKHIVFHTMDISSESVEEIQLVVKGAIERKDSPVIKFCDRFHVKLIGESYYIEHCCTSFVITDYDKVIVNHTKDDALYFFYKYQHILMDFFLAKAK